MTPKQRVRLLRRLRKSRNRAAHREQTWEKVVNEGRWKWSNKARAILWSHKMWKAYKRSPPPTSDFERAFRSEGKQATPESLNWARRTASDRHKARCRISKSFTNYIQDQIKRPGFARQILTPQ